MLSESFMNNLDERNENISYERKKIMEFLRDYIIGPNLEILSHRNIMLLVGNDFTYHTNSDFINENRLLKMISNYSL